MANDTYLLVGLGNPGTKYNNTRHNVGFAVIDAIGRANGVCCEQDKWQSHTEKATLWSNTIHLVKPMTYMNRSGQAVARFASYYRVPSERIIIIHDDLDMVTGRLKLVAGGGAGGHNGIKSISSHLSSKDYFRLKVGIGRPDSSIDFPIERYVLTRFSDKEAEIIDARCAEIIFGLELFFLKSLSQAMNYINSFK